MFKKKSTGHDRDHMGGIEINVSGVLGRDGGRGEGTNGSLSGGDKLVPDVQNCENLLCLGIIGNAESVDLVETQNVVIQVFADQERAQGLAIFVGGQECVGSIKFEVVVAGPDDVCSMIRLLGMREVLLEGLQGQTGSSRPRII